MDDVEIQALPELFERISERDVFGRAVGVEQNERASLRAIDCGSQDAHARRDADAVGDKHDAARPGSYAEAAVWPVDAEARPGSQARDPGAEAFVGPDRERDPRGVRGV